MTQIRLTSAVIVAGQHRNEGETIDVPSDLARSLIARGLAEPVSAARASAAQPTLALDAPAPPIPPANVAKAFAEAGEHFARAAALSADLTHTTDTKNANDDEDLDPLASDALSTPVDPADLADPDTTRDPSDADKAPPALAPPGEPATAPEGESSASSSRKRRRR